MTLDISRKGFIREFNEKAFDAKHDTYLQQKVLKKYNRVRYTVIAPYIGFTKKQKEKVKSAIFEFVEDALEDSAHYSSSQDEVMEWGAAVVGGNHVWQLFFPLKGWQDNRLSDKAVHSFLNWLEEAPVAEARASEDIVQTLIRCLEDDEFDNLNIWNYDESEEGFFYSHKQRVKKAKAKPTPADEDEDEEDPDPESDEDEDEDEDKDEEEKPKPSSAIYWWVGLEPNTKEYEAALQKFCNE